MIFGSDIQICGHVDIRHGQYRQRVPNHIVDSMLQSLLAEMIANSVDGPQYTYLYMRQPRAPAYLNPSPYYEKFMVLGTDTTTVTAPSMTGLVAPIGAAPGTLPSLAMTSSMVDGSATGIWSVTYQATWSPVDLPAAQTIGELGLILHPNLQTQFGYNITATYEPTNSLGSRLAVADGDFAAFTVNNTVSLIVTWTITFSFV